MIASKSCELAIKALVLIAKNNTGKPIRISYLHKELEVGVSFMTKILQPLTHSGILHSLKGAKGGILLNEKPENINLKQIVEIMDGDSLFTKCVFNLQKCGSSALCEFHKSWKPVRKLITQTFENTTLANLSNAETQLKFQKLIN